MYVLMNKDKEVALLNITKKKEYNDIKKLEIVKTYNKLPIGFRNINAWVDNRKASKHSAHLQNIMEQMGCSDVEGFIKLTHAASINDTFWIKSDNENVSWDQISLYQNQFTKTISRLAFEGVGLYDSDFSTTSPELTCDGSFKKCFRKESSNGEFGSDIFLYKRGSEFGAGLEPYCEQMASEIARHISPNNFVSYSLVRLHGKLASKCNLFTNEQYGYASYAKVVGPQQLDFSEIAEYYEKIGSEQELREMLVIDALCFNEDRHAGNFGVLFDNDTLEIKCMAPVFDLNVSLLRNAKPSDFPYIGDVIFNAKPKIGDDFTRMGQIALNDKLRDKVKDMRDFKFSFRGNKDFSPERVELLETIVQKQAAAILSHDKLKTTDVFFSQEANKLAIKNKEFTHAAKRLDKFMFILDEMRLGEDILISECASTDIVQCYVEKDSAMLTLDFFTKQATASYNCENVEIEKLQQYDSGFYEMCKKICEKWNEFNAAIPKSNHGSQSLRNSDQTSNINAAPIDDLDNDDPNSKYS